MLEYILKTWDILRYYDNIWVQLAIAAVIILIALLFRNLITRIIFNLVLRLTSKTKTGVDSAIVLAFEGPFRTLILVTGLYFALTYLGLPRGALDVINTLFRSAIIILISSGFYNLAGGPAVTEIGVRLEVEKTVVGFVTKVFRFVIIALTITIIAQEWEYDVSGFIAGLGLGGLAFALAAQDAAKNIFGGIVILLDKPFAVGDWIMTPSVEGTVEDMTFRSTKVRTFANALVTVPNAVVANEAITNWTRMQKRRVSFHLGVTYTTPREKMQICVKRIKELLDNNPEVHPDTIFVRFDQFNDSSLDIFIYYFTNTTVWGEFMAVKEAINFKIMEILEEEGVSIAFPSRSIYFENQLKKAEREAGRNLVSDENQENDQAGKN
ncbi:MAG: mechanosensitive ion channel family protein [Bacillota bacterium]